MLQILKLTVGQLQTNCYLIANQKTRRTIVIDPGDDADYISRIIKQEQLSPTQIVATHGHFDHILAAAELQTAYNIPFLIHPNDQFLVNEVGKRAKFFLNIGPIFPPTINNHLREGTLMSLDGTTLNVIETPGHTPGHISLYCKEEKVIFCGDVLFAGGGVGRTDFTYSNTSDLQASIQKILALPQTTTIYSGHGPRSTVEREKQLHKFSTGAGYGN